MFVGWVDRLKEASRKERTLRRVVPGHCALCRDGMQTVRRVGSDGHQVPNHHVPSSSLARVMAHGPAH